MRVRSEERRGRETGEMEEIVVEGERGERRG